MYISFLALSGGESVRPVKQRHQLALARDLLRVRIAFFHARKTRKSIALVLFVFRDMARDEIFGADHGGEGAHRLHKPLLLLVKIACGLLPGASADQKADEIAGQKTAVQKKCADPLAREYFADGGLRLLKAAAVHQAVAAKDVDRGDQGIFSVCPLGDLKERIRHISEPLAARDLFADLQLHVKCAVGEGILVQREGVAAVVVDHSHMQRDAVVQREEKADEGTDEKKYREERKRQGKEENEKDRREQKIHKRAAEVKEHGGDAAVFVGGGRCHHTLPRRACDREPCKTEAALHPSEHQAADAEGGEAVAREQAENEMPRLVHDQLQIAGEDEGPCNLCRDIHERSQEHSRICSREELREVPHRRLLE